MKALLALSAALVVCAGPASAASFSGNWPVTVTHSQRANGTYCVTLTDDGRLHFPHSGHVSLTTPSGSKVPYGTFQVINRVLTVTAQEQGETENAGLVFSARVRAGSIGEGIYDQIYGGEEFDSGAIAFGVKGGC